MFRIIDSSIINWYIY